MRILAAILLTLGAIAQPVPEYEIRGSVLEFGSAAPIAAAEVALKEFVSVDNVITPKIIATALSNARGEFSFKPGHIGNFYIETKKAGYGDANIQSGAPTAEIPLSLTEKSPVGAVRFQLMRPSEMVGRVVDSSGNPAAHLRMTMESPGQLTTAFRTDAEGRFQLSVSPGPYILQTASRTEAIDSEPPTGPEYDADHWLDYSDENFQAVDEEYESLYWPSGVSNRDLALPMQAAPGAVANFGTITLRKVPAYRARITFQGECLKGEAWKQAFAPFTQVGRFSSFTGLECGKDFLLRGLQPGKYMLVAWSDLHWAQTDFQIVDRNIAVKMTMSPARQLEGRVVVPDGVQLASLGVIHILATPEHSMLGYEAPGANVGPDGKFVLKNVLWPSQSIQALIASPDLYVKRIRDDGTSIEIVLGNDAASIGGAVTDSGVPGPATLFLTRWPLAEPITLEKWMATHDDGTFNLTGIAPGEHRLFALPGGGNNVPPQDVLKRLFTDGMRITLEAHEQRTIDVKR